MNPLLIFAAGAVMASAGVLLREGDVASHKQRMIAAEEIQYVVLDGLESRSAAKAAKAADRLVGLLAKEDRYWRQSGLDDAIALAELNLAAARQISVRAKANDLDAATMAFGELHRTCVECHELHPENRILVAH